MAGPGPDRLDVLARELLRALKPESVGNATEISVTKAQLRRVVMKDLEIIDEAGEAYGAMARIRSWWF